MRWTADALRALDAQDPLAPFRDRFVLPRGCVYLAAHLFGPMPARAPEAIARALETHWGAGLAELGAAGAAGELCAQVARDIARLIGAAPHEIAVGDTVTINAFKLVAAAVDLRPGRPVLLAERGSTPELISAAQSVSELLRGEVELRLLEEGEPLAEALDERVACFLASHVDDRSGGVHDLAALVTAAHEVGALLLVDLSHSAGVMPVALDAANVDLAIGSGARYLCGGPGAPAFLYVAERHLEKLRSSLHGWERYAYSNAFELRAPLTLGIERLVVSRPSPLALAALHCGVALVGEADLEQVREKALRLSAAFAAIAADRLTSFAVACASPGDAEARGALLAFAHPQAPMIARALAEQGIMADVRRPDLLRFGFGPLWNSYEEVWIAAERLAEVVVARSLHDRSAHTPSPPS